MPSTYFGHYVSHFFTRNQASDVSARIGALQAEQERVFLHLRKATCYVAGIVVHHDALRVRLADVTAWTVAGITTTPELDAEAPSPTGGR